MASLERAEINTAANNGEFRALLDPIHSGIKFAEMGTFLGGGAVGFFGISLLLANPLLATGAALAMAIGGSLGVGRLLKNRWPSGRELIADAEHIALTKNGKNEVIINPQLQVNVLSWYFEVKKDHPRARKGWYLLGLGLEQDESSIILYAALPPKEFEKLKLAKAFIKLEKIKDKEKVVDSAAGMRRAGEQRRLYEAEVLRQIDGGDMESPDFVAFLDFLQAKYPRWMIS